MDSLTKHISMFRWLWVGREYWSSLFALWFLWSNLVWYLYLAQIGFSQASGRSLTHYSISIAGWLLKNLSCFYLIWLSCIWIIWRDTNSRVFQQKGNTINQLLDKIKLQSFWWLKANHPNFAFHYHTWWLNPHLFLGVVTKHLFVSVSFCVSKRDLCCFSASFFGLLM